MKNLQESINTCNSALGICEQDLIVKGGESIKSWEVKAAHLFQLKFSSIAEDMIT